jgi:hypothetical protein
MTTATITLVEASEPAVFTYAFTSKGNVRTKRVITEITPGMYEVETTTRSSYTVRVPGGIVLMMMNADFDNKGLNIDLDRPSALNRYSYYQTGLETSEQDMQILISLNEAGKVVTKVVPNSFFS